MTENSFDNQDFNSKYDDVINKYHEDIIVLEKIAAEHNNKLNLSMIFITIKCETDDESQYILEYFTEKGIEILTEDIEPDNTDEESYDTISINPFDPSKIDIKFSQMIISAILDRIKYNEIDFESDFQRKAGLWDRKQKSQLIESILLKIPLPAFYFDATNDDKWIIIDGLQRISTLKEFVVDKKLKLTGMEFLHDLNGKKFDQLPRSLQRRIGETNITAYIVNPATPPNVKYNIFKRINTGGLVLEPQEIRNALFQGAATTFLKRLSNSKAFVNATCNSIKSDRMADREFCLRYIAFTTVPLENYRGNIDDHLNETMELINKMSQIELLGIESNFNVVMCYSEKIFGKYAFRKMADDGRRRPINKAIFEAWSNVLFHLNKIEKEKLCYNNKLLIKHFINLCDDYNFQSNLRSSDKSSVINRINSIKEIVKRILEEQK